MEIVESLITFFGIDLIGETSTFPDLLSCMLKIGVSLWLTIFIIRSMFLVTSIGEIIKTKPHAIKKIYII